MPKFAIIDGVKLAYDEPLALGFDPSEPRKEDGEWTAEALEAIKNTPGAEKTATGLKVDLSRYQDPEQAGADSVRTGVFFLPEKNSPYKKHYTTGKNGYGGKQRIDGSATYKNPMVVKAGTGGQAIVKAYDKIKGKGAYEAMRSDILSHAIPNFYKNDVGEHMKRVSDILEKYGGRSDMADYIVDNSKGGNLLPYALQEHIAAHAIRDAGYDAVISHSKHQGAPRLSEVFDVTQQQYPTPGEAEFSLAFDEDE